MGVKPEFYQEIEKEVKVGTYKKYDESDNTMGLCAKKAWVKVWEDKKAGNISRTFSADYECTIPAEYSEDGKNHCHLYIAITK